MMWKTAGVVAIFLISVQIALGQQQQRGFNNRQQQVSNNDDNLDNDGGILNSGRSSSSSSSQGRIDACKTKSRLAPHPDFCDEYFECIDGQEVQRICPNGLVFVGKSHGLVGSCHYPFVGDCQDRQKRHPAIQTEHCDWLYGIFGHETSCTRYWTCWNGTATEQFCIGGLLYNEKTRACDWPENVEGCQKHPLCKDFPNGNVALGKSCNRYWHCQGGYPRLQRCPAMLVFDKNSLRCVVPPTEDCEVPSTTTEANNQDNSGGQDEEEGGNNNNVQQPQQQPSRGNNNRPLALPGGARPISLPGGAIPIGTQRFNPQPAQPQFSGLPQFPGGAIPLGNVQQQQRQPQQQQSQPQQQQQQQRNRFQQQ